MYVDTFLPRDQGSAEEKPNTSSLFFFFFFTAMHPPPPPNVLSQNNEADDYDHTTKEGERTLTVILTLNTAIQSKTLWLMMIYDKFGCSCNQVSFILVYIWM